MAMAKKTRLFNQIHLLGPVFRQLALIKMESFPAVWMQLSFIS